MSDKIYKPAEQIAKELRQEVLNITMLASKLAGTIPHLDDERSINIVLNVAISIIRELDENPSTVKLDESVLAYEQANNLMIDFALMTDYYHTNNTKQIVRHTLFMLAYAVRLMFELEVEVADNELDFYIDELSQWNDKSLIDIMFGKKLYDECNEKRTAYKLKFQEQLNEVLATFV